MKLLLENWREFLEEIEENNRSRSLGNQVFPKDDPRIWKKYLYKGQGELEPDTEWEERLRAVLGAHFSNPTVPSLSSDDQLTMDTAITQDVARTIKGYIINKEYPETFQRYRKGKVYRGMGVDPKWFERNFGRLPKKPKWYSSPIDTLQKKAEREVNYGKLDPQTRRDRSEKERSKATGKPIRLTSVASSWTTSLSDARAFTLQSGLDNPLRIVFVADSKKDFFVDAEPLYQYSFAERWEGENEVIGLGAITITDLIWYYDE